MARKLRVFVENTSQHILLNSINGLTLFVEEVDYVEFMHILEKLSLKYELSMHAYVIMPQYFEFVATPKYEVTLSKFMQSLGRLYVSYYNKKYNRSGTLFEGRYKASLVEDSVFLFDIMKYIEQKESTSYEFSSVRKNLFNKLNPVVSPNSLYKSLGFTDAKRIENYAKIFYSHTDDEKNEFILRCLDKQLVTGTTKYVKELEKLVGMTLLSKSRGRPKKQTQVQRKKMYKNLVLLDKEQHKELKLSPLENLSYAKDTAFIPVLANEVVLVGASFPVVFTGGKIPSLVSIVTLGGDSLAINADGKWITNYVPSYLRKYPFSLGSTKNNPEQKVILIDEESSLFSKSKGKQLFKKNGEQSDMLSHAIEFLTSHETGSVVTASIVKDIVDSDILEEREISVGEGDEKKVLVNGFKVVDREKLYALSDDILADWVRKGVITMIESHIKSLDNIQTLFNIAHERQN